MKLMDRFPITIVIGAGLLGWIAGDMTITDTVTKEWGEGIPLLQWIAPAVGALLVVILGKWLAARASAQRATRTPQLSDLADTDHRPPHS
jgi:predicted tellurium resistance membrane protein TerC